MGIDIVDVARIARLLDAPRGGFATRWFTPDEVAECDAEPHRASAFAERLAAKEAIWKALGAGGDRGPVPWRRISVLRAAEAGRARVALAGPLAGTVGTIHLDWATTDGVVVAVAVVEASAE